MDNKEFVISYLKTRNYWWQTREVSPADKGIVRHEYLEEIRAIEKLFFCEEGLRRALTLDMDAGKSAENVVAWHLIKRGYRRKVFFNSYYWKNKQEVDFVYDDSKLIIPVEVKYREHPVTADTKGLIEFMHTFDLNIGIIVTKDMLKQEKIGDKEILFVPLWLFLLLL